MSINAIASLRYITTDDSSQDFNFQSYYLKAASIKSDYRIFTPHIFYKGWHIKYG
jgi:hypothetical protein